MDTYVPRLADHDRSFCRCISAGLAARGTGLRLCSTWVLPLLPSPQGGCQRKASCHHPLSRRRHSDTWWELGATTRTSRKPLMGIALVPVSHRASGLLSQSIPPGAKIHHFAPAQSPGHWGPLETSRRASRGFNASPHKDFVGAWPGCSIYHSTWLVGLDEASRKVWEGLSLA